MHPLPRQGKIRGLILNSAHLQTVSHRHRPEGEKALLKRGQRKPVGANTAATRKSLVQQQCEKRLLRINTSSSRGSVMVLVYHAKSNSYYVTVWTGTKLLNSGTTEISGFGDWRSLSLSVNNKLKHFSRYTPYYLADEQLRTVWTPQTLLLNRCISSLHQFPWHNRVIIHHVTKRASFQVYFRWAERRGTDFICPHKSISVHISSPWHTAHHPVLTGFLS